MSTLRLRPAALDDAEAVAQLHTNSWRRHYRGAYSDSFLDGDVFGDRLAVWSTRLADPGDVLTLLAEDGATAIGFIHVVFDEDTRWGSLVDNLHVTPLRQRCGVGSALLVRAAQAVVSRAAGSSMHLWVLEQNLAAQQFYGALGGAIVEKAMVTPPGGAADRLHGTPVKLRCAWPDVAGLAAREQ